MNFKQFYEQNSNRDYPDFLDYLKSNGWEWTGSGAFGTVFKKPNKNYVLKVYRNDPAYDNFLNFIEENQNDPHIPKIKRRILPLSNNQSKDYGIVAIEKLDSLKSSDWRWRLVSSFENTLYNTIGNLSFDEYLNNAIEEVRNIYKENLETAKLRKFRNTRSESRKLRRLDYFVESNLGIFKSIYRLKKFLESNGESHMFDMHSGNFMIRPSTGEIIVTDPIAH